MDRARACGCVSNNFVQNQQRLKQRKDHLDRIKKIRNRKPGTSTTIDCQPPTLLHASAAEKRKAGRRVLYGLTVERENKYVYIKNLSYFLKFLNHSYVIK